MRYFLVECIWTMRLSRYIVIENVSVSSIFLYFGSDRVICLFKIFFL